MIRCFAAFDLPEPSLRVSSLRSLGGLGQDRLARQNGEETHALSSDPGCTPARLVRRAVQASLSLLEPLALIGCHPRPYRESRLHLVANPWTGSRRGSGFIMGFAAPRRLVGKPSAAGDTDRRVGRQPWPAHEPATAPEAMGRPSRAYRASRSPLPVASRSASSSRTRTSRTSCSVAHSLIARSSPPSRSPGPSSCRPARRLVGQELDQVLRRI